MVIYKIFNADGSYQNVPRKKTAELETLQKWVGGNIEVADSPVAGTTVYCNEDGIRLKLPRNPFFKNLLGNVVMEVNQK